MVIWGLREGAEHGKMQSREDFLQEELFGKHMGLERIVPMSAHECCRPEIDLVDQDQFMCTF